jgi:alkylation response protein AidB-like acyl-CoA dehydrogenase
MTTAVRSSRVGVVDDLAPTIVQYSDQAETERNLGKPVFEAMRDAGLMRMFVPQELGGLESDVIESFEVIESISQLDSAAGWVLQIMSTGATIGAIFDDEGAREIYGDPRSTVAGGFNPPGAALPVAGGYRLNGRWGFSSGSHHATWLIGASLKMGPSGPAMTPEGQPIMVAAIYRAAEATVLQDTWDPLGMRGTGSYDVVAEDVFVPESRVAVLRPFDPVGSAYGGPLYRLGIVPTLLGNAVVALGVARAAIDEAVDLSRTRIPAFNQARPVARGVVHTQLARAEATLSAARAYFYGALGDAWQTARSGSRLSPRERLHCQLAGSHAAEASAAAVDLVHAAVGSSGMRESGFRFARHFRDVHTITQHALCSGARYESMGQVMPGLETDWPFFHF